MENTRRVLSDGALWIVLVVLIGLTVVLDNWDRTPEVEMDPIVVTAPEGEATWE